MCYTPCTHFTYSGLPHKAEHGVGILDHLDSGEAELDVPFYAAAQNGHQSSDVIDVLLEKREMG